MPSRRRALHSAVLAAALAGLLAGCATQAADSSAPLINPFAKAEKPKDGGYKDGVYELS